MLDDIDGFPQRSTTLTTATCRCGVAGEEVIRAAENKTAAKRQQQCLPRAAAHR
jgi:hypothetical protein